MRMTTRKLKLRPHYFWLCGLFAAGGLIAATIQSREPEETHAAGEGIQNGMYMQDITPEICNNTPIGSTQYTVKDKRDNKSYTVARIANKVGGGANCWMTKNLAFDIKNQSTKMTPELSDVTTDKTVWANKMAVIKNSTFTSPGDSSAWYTNSTPTTIKSGSYSSTYGYYYTWCAASAGSCSEAPADSATPSRIRASSMSICPKGWKIPTGGTNGEYYNLLNGLSKASAAATPYKLSLGGYMTELGLNDGGTDGRYWASSSTLIGAYTASITSSSVSPGTTASPLYFGYSVRCVAANALEEIDTMQQMTADVCAKANIGDTATLTDERDGKLYTIAKIKNAVDDEANCWMTSNLAFDIKNKANRMVASLSDVTKDMSTWASGVTIQNDKFSDDNTLAQYTNTVPTTKVSDSGSYSTDYGYYYSWCAATASTCSEATSDTSQPAVRSASRSICPKGWKLPTGGENGQYYSFTVGLDKASIIAYPYHLSAAGYMDTDGLHAGGKGGSYWSSSSYSLTEAYRLGFDSDDFYPGTGNGSHYLGSTVRCIAGGTSAGSDSTSANFSVTVDDAITMVGAEFTNSDGGDSIHGVPGSVAEGKISVEVGSNVKYKISMRADNPNLASSNPDNTNTIPTISDTDTNTPVQSTLEGLRTSYGWGIKPITTDLNPETNDNQYIGILPIDQTFYTSTTTAGASTTSTFPVGVGLSPTLPSDTYSTEVTITAIATE